MVKEKFYTCKYDRPFKEIMLKKQNKDILKSLLEKILKVEINKIDINNIERNTGNLEIKRKNLDALLTTSIGKIGIEVNALNKPYVKPRNMAYICDIYASHTLVGEEYDEETKIIQINFSYGLKEDYKYTTYKIQNNNKKEFVKNFLIYEVNMDYYKKLWYTEDERVIEENIYIIMLDLDKEELEKISKKDKVVKKYMEEIVKLNGSTIFREYMTREEDLRKIRNSLIMEEKKKSLEKGMKQGMKQGMKNGIEEGILKVAKNLKNMGMSEDEIITATGLSVSKIKEL